MRYPTSRAANLKMFLTSLTAIAMAHDLIIAEHTCFEGAA
jgi:hypothetical protein